uniref:Uncharacterized protein n=1 Tax=Palpitomonas bilix TaxID=652834 RepID=A0A7S3GKC9_9EUKA
MESSKKKYVRISSAGLREAAHKYDEYAVAQSMLKSSQTPEKHGLAGEFSQSATQFGGGRSSAPSPSPSSSPSPSMLRPRSADPTASLDNLRESSSIIHRRYYFPGKESGVPFMKHYDVVKDLAGGKGGLKVSILPGMQDASPVDAMPSPFLREKRRANATRATMGRQGLVTPTVLPPEVDVRTMYYVEKKVLAAEAFSWQQHLNDKKPSGQIDGRQLAAWLDTIKPRTREDALPLFHLLQNVLRSVLQEKLRIVDKQASVNAMAQVLETRKEFAARASTFVQEKEEDMESSHARVKYMLAECEAEKARLMEEVGNLREEMDGVRRDLSMEKEENARVRQSISTIKRISETHRMGKREIESELEKMREKNNMLEGAVEVRLQQW